MEGLNETQCRQPGLATKYAELKIRDQRVLNRLFSPFYEMNRQKGDTQGTQTGRRCRTEYRGFIQPLHPLMSVGGPSDVTHAILSLMSYYYQSHSVLGLISSPGCGLSVIQGQSKGLRAFWAFIFPLSRQPYLPWLYSYFLFQ